MYDKNNKIMLDTINNLNLGIYFYDTEKVSYGSQMDVHSHDVYELYVILSGEISFMVNDRIYHLQSGDIIIARPHEYHHVIFNESVACRRFVLFFSEKGATQIFESALKNVGSHVVLPTEKRKRFIALCHTLLESKTSQFSNFYQILELLHLLTYGSKSTLEYDSSVLPKDVTSSMHFIENNLSKNITIQEIAKNAHVSVNTLERHFKKFLSTSPKDFIKQKRLTRSCTLLAEGYNVQETCDACGFPDYSHFISCFKKEYGMTPLKYQKAKK